MTIKISKAKFGAFLRAIRDQKKMSRAKFSELLEVPERFIVEMELSQTSFVSLERLFQISEMLELMPGDLVNQYVENPQDFNKLETATVELPFIFVPEDVEYIRQTIKARELYRQQELSHEQTAAQN